MNSKLRYLILILLLSISGGVLIGGTGSAEGEAPYFSNKDLERYKEPSDSKSSISVSSRNETKKESAARLQPRKDGEYWCKKATSYRRKIEKGRDDISSIEKDLSDENLSRKKRTPLEKRLAKAQKQVAYLEKDLADFEDEARRKDIPPGWLRCQFE